MIITVITAVLLAIGIACLFGLTPRQVTADLIRLLTPRESLWESSIRLRNNKKRHYLYNRLTDVRQALIATGQESRFALVCFGAVVGAGCGVIVAMMLDNVFLLPVLTITMALLPFFYISYILNLYQKQTENELETTLSTITTSYLRSNDIQAAIAENLKYIKPPLKESFSDFLGDIRINADIKHALYLLKDRVDNEIFREWCDGLISCQENHVLKDTLLPIIGKLTDVRVVNTELKTLLAETRMEYWSMVALLVGNVPLLYVLNRDWFATLLYETAGKAVVGVCGAAILVTAILMTQFTKPIRYKR